MYTAIIKLDPLTDTVRTTTKNDDFLAVGDFCLVFRFNETIAFIHGIHVRGARREFGRTGINALVNRAQAKGVTIRTNGVFVLASQFCKTCVREAELFEAQQFLPVGRDAVGTNFFFLGDQHFDLLEVPGVKLGRTLNFLKRQAVTESLGSIKDTERDRLGQLGTDGGLVRRTFDFDFIEAGKPGFHRPQTFLQAFGKAATDGHRFADRLHGSPQKRLGAREFFKGEARDLGDDIVDGRLERGRGDAGDIVIKFIQGVTNRKLGCDLGNRETGCLGCQGGRTRHARVHFNDDQATVIRVDRELNVRAAGIHTDLAQNG